MSRYSGKRSVSPQTEIEAEKMAKATQRPGQTREQTKQIALGIRKGIDEYKKQQKARQRELSKRFKKQQASTETTEDEAQVEIIVRQHWLPWALLIISWTGFAGLAISLA